ncbi:MAG: YicC family protein [Firmicutes bacterium]|nr:YicC family protein [Bacillota bacterium]
MVASMTGYGQAENDPHEALRIKVELRSVNHRYLDIAIRLPREIQAVEEYVRRCVQQEISRGHLDINISWRSQADDTINVAVDRALVQAYQKALIEIGELCSLKQSPDLAMLARLPDVISIEKEQMDIDEVWTTLKPVLEQAIHSLIKQRQEEGARLEADIQMRLNLLAEIVAQIEKRAPLIVDEYRKKIEERLKEYLVQVEIDQARLLTEAAIFADRSNVTEELVRLSSHIKAFRETLQQNGVIGRKLDFITQEMLRETNTIGSKANDYLVAKLVVELKTELEKIREQVQNIE